MSIKFQLGKYSRNYKKFNVNSNSKKGHDSVTSVTSPCLAVGVMMMYRCAEFQSHMSMDFENI
jgi:hypothetical protein